MALCFSPLPGQLPKVSFEPVVQLRAEIGGQQVDIFSCATTGSSYAVVRPGLKTQSGSVNYAAKVVCSDGHWAYVLPYNVVCIKKEWKLAVQEAQTRLASRNGEGGDNSMLDKTLLVLFNQQRRVSRDAEHIVGLIETWHDDDALYTVMDCYLDELRELLSRSPHGVLPEELIRGILAQVLCGLRGLHSAGWAHRDISPENICCSTHRFFSQTRTGVPVPKTVLIDLGTAVAMKRAPLPPPSPPPGESGQLVSRPSSCSLPAPPLIAPVPAIGAAGAGSRLSSCGTPNASSRQSSVGFSSTTSAPSSLGGFLPLQPPPKDHVFCKMKYADPLFFSGPKGLYYGVAFDLWSVAQTLYCSVAGTELYHAPLPEIDGAFRALVVSERTLEQQQQALSGAALHAAASAAVLTSCTGTVAESARQSSQCSEIEPAASSQYPRRCTSGSITASTSSSSTSTSTGSSSSSICRTTSTSVESGCGPYPAVLPPSPFAAHLQELSARRVAVGLEPLSSELIDLLCRLFRLKPAFRPVSAQAVLQHPWFQQDRHLLPSYVFQH